MENATTIESELSIYLMGGLGNQLFQIAAAFSHAKRLNRKFIIPINCELPKYYFKTLFKNMRHYFKKTLSTEFVRYNEPCFHYIPLPSFSSPDNSCGKIELRGYFQSSKYFSDYTNEIREFLEIPQDIQEKYRAKYGDFFKKYSDKNLVLVHARRGDYLTLSKFHNPQSSEYYKLASEYVGEKIETPFYVLISDDESFWKDVPCFNADNSVIFSEEDTIGTFYFMQQMKYFIISNSSFSWWGAWLAKENRLTIAPKNWFGPEGPQDWYDIYESNWIQI